MKLGKELGCSYPEMVSMCTRLNVPSLRLAIQAGPGGDVSLESSVLVS